MTPEEKKTIFIMTANGKSRDNGFVCVKLVDDTSAVLSLAMLCGTMGYSYSKKAGDQTSLIKDGVTFTCTSEEHVPVVALTRKKATRTSRRRLLARLVQNHSLKV